VEKTAPCVLLPVYNATRNLEPAVGEILDVLPDLCNRFQVCLFDDGSTDDTSDTAYELAARYPQVRCCGMPCDKAWRPRSRRPLRARVGT
jgi:glycosyltransferase involved in cell wall biosynthesis